MPMYEFRCKKCDHIYQELTKHDPDGKYSTVKCPECGSKRKEMLVGGGNFNFANPVGTDRWCNSHDYRFYHNLPNVRAQRAAAEAASKGDNPYPEEIDDISCGKYFGEPK